MNTHIFLLGALFSTAILQMATSQIVPPLNDQPIPSDQFNDRSSSIKERALMKNLPLKSKASGLAGARKNGISIALLTPSDHHNPGSLVAVDQDGNLIQGFEERLDAFDVIPNIIWLDDTHFASITVEKTRTVYGLYTIWEDLDGKHIELSCTGSVEGKVEFRSIKSSLIIMRDEKKLFQVDYINFH